MELLELTTKIKELFQVDDLKDFGDAARASLSDESKLDAFVSLVGGDLSVDWLQRVYQYYLADRGGKKQDFTPPCLAELLSELVGDCDLICDLCAGTGALTIQRWKKKPDQTFGLYEIDENVVPYLLFNLVVRNTNALVRVGDALANEFPTTYRIRKGKKYSSVSDDESGFPVDAPRSVVSNPPYNIKFDVPLAGFLPQYNLGEPPANNANYAFVLTGLCRSTKRAAFLLPNCVLSPVNSEKKIVGSILAANYLRAVVALPSGMFESTQIPTCVLLLDREKQTLKVEFVDLTESASQEIREQRGQFGGASHTGRVCKKSVNVLSSETIAKAVRACNEFENVSNFAACVDPDEIFNNGLDLSPKRYIRAEREQIEHRSFKDIARDYNAIVKQKNAIRIKFNRTAFKRFGFDESLFARSEELDKELSKSFALVGQQFEKDDAVTFTNSDGIEIKVSTKEGYLPPIVDDFLKDWTQYIRTLNLGANRLLAEFRDALLPKLMSGEIDVSKLGD